MVILSLGPALFLLGLSLMLKSTFVHTIESEAQSILGGDVEITSTRPMSPQDEGWLTEILKSTAHALVIELVSNVTHGELSALAEIKGVSKNYPLIGKSHFEKDLNVSLDLWKNLDLKHDEILQVGNLKVKVDQPLNRNLSSQQFRFSPAEPLFLSQDLLIKTGLIAPGSLVYYRRYDLCPLISQETKNEIEKRGYFVRTKQDAVKTIEKGLNFALQIVDLAVMFLSVLCFIVSFYSLHTLLQNRSALLGLLTCYGVKRIARAGYLFTLALLAVQLSLLMGTVLLIMTSVLTPLNFEFGIILKLQILGLILCLGIWAAHLIEMKSRSVFQLLKQEDQPPILMSLALGLLFSFGLALFWFENKMYLLFFIGFECLTLLFSCLIIPKLLKTSLGLVQVQKIVLLSLRNLSKPRSGHILLFQTFFTALFVQLLLLHFGRAVEKELAPQSEVTPQFFVSNIQPEDLDQLISDVTSLGGQFENPSRLFLGRLEKINDKPVESDQLKRFPLRMTESSKLKRSESVFEGSNEIKQGQVSLELEFAKRNNIKLNDLLQFELQGEEVKALVSQIRSIEWNQFQPNFFIQFPKGTLERFPFSMIGTARGSQSKEQFQSQLLKKHPAVSVIDIAKILERLSDLLRQIKKPLIYFLIGVAVFLSILITMILSFSFSLRRTEMALLETFGASQNQRRLYLLTEFLFLFLLSYLFANMSARWMSYLVLKKIFLTPWNFEFQLYEFLPLLNLILFSLPLLFFVRQTLRVQTKDLM